MTIKTSFVTVRVLGRDMAVASAALKAKIAATCPPDSRVVALTSRSAGIWDWQGSIQLLAVVEHTA